MDLYNADEIYTACRLLKDLVENKHVILNSCAVDWKYLPEFCAPYPALSFKCWHCQSITFDKHCKAHWKHVDTVSIIITSPTPHQSQRLLSNVTRYSLAHHRRPGHRPTRRRFVAVSRRCRRIRPLERGLGFRRLCLHRGEEQNSRASIGQRK